MDLVQHAVDIALVHLEHGRRGGAIGDQGGHVPCRHVGAGGVGGDRAQAVGDGHGQHPRGRRLAVRPADQGHDPVLAQLAEQLGVEGQAGPPADDRAAPPPEGA